MVISVFQNLGSMTIDLTEHWSTRVSLFVNFGSTWIVVLNKSFTIFWSKGVMILVPWFFYSP